jgi:hypothetical protein
MLHVRPASSRTGSLTHLGWPGEPWRSPGSAPNAGTRRGHSISSGDASYADRPDAQQAEAYHRQAIVLATDLGMRPLIAHCHLGLAKLRRRRGDRGQAQEHLTIATTMYREMDMPSWLEQAEAENASAGIGMALCLRGPRHPLSGICDAHHFRRFVRHGRRSYACRDLASCARELFTL